MLGLVILLLVLVGAVKLVSSLASRARSTTDPEWLDRLPELKVNPRPLAEDIQVWLNRDFAEGERAPASQMLSLSQLGDREQRCALFLAKGDVAGLQRAVDLGKSDYRDLIMAAEYEPGPKRVRDFSEPQIPATS